MERWRSATDHEQHAPPPHTRPTLQDSASKHPTPRRPPVPPRPAEEDKEPHARVYSDSIKMGDSKADNGPADFEGYLTKQSAWLKEWRKRYFVLQANKLHFKKTPDAAPHGTIDLKECLTVKSAEEKTGKRYVHFKPLSVTSITIFSSCSVPQRSDH